MMDIEKLIRRLRNDADAYRNGETLGRAFADQEDVLDNAATALSTLQAENEKLRAELEQKSKLITQQAEELERRDTLLKEQEDELEQVKRCIEIVEHQRDEAIYDMTALMAGQCCDLCAVEYCNNRGKTEMCTAFKWRGPQKED